MTGQPQRSSVDAATLAEVLQSAAEALPTLDGPGQAIVWVSGALGLWRDDPSVDAAAADLDLLEAAVAAGVTDLLAALALVDPAVLPIAAPAAEAYRCRSVGGASPPRWYAADPLQAVAAWIVRDRDVPAAVIEETVAITFVAADGETHAMLCDVDSGGAAAVRFGPDPIGGEGGLLTDPGQADGVGPGLDVESVGVEQAAEAVAAALRQARASRRSVRDETIANLVAAADHLVRAGLCDVADLVTTWPSPGEVDDPSDHDDSADAEAEADAEADTAAREVLRSALRSQLADPVAAAGLAAAAARIRAASVAGAWPAAALAAAAGLTPEECGDDATLVASTAAAVVMASRQPIDGLDEDEHRCLSRLEWADWLGVVIGLVRAGPGSDVTEDSLVDMVNRCPEVTTTIARSDRDWVRAGFSVALACWEAVGVVDRGRLTDVGAWALLCGVENAWNHDTAQ